MGSVPDGGGVNHLQVTPCTIAEAQAFVDHHHRHHKAPRGALFAVAVSSIPKWNAAPEVRGVAIVGRPVARGMQDGWTVEITRCCTDGARNACSMLYRAAWRAARALGYSRVITYTLSTEPGESLRGAGFKVVGEVRGRSWSCQARPRVDKTPAQNKLRWEAA